MWNTVWYSLMVYMLFDKNFLEDSNVLAHDIQGFVEGGCNV